MIPKPHCVRTNSSSHLIHLANLPNHTLPIKTDRTQPVSTHHQHAHHAIFSPFPQPRSPTKENFPTERNLTPHRRSPHPKPPSFARQNPALTAQNPGKQIRHARIFFFCTLHACMHPTIFWVRESLSCLSSCRF